MLAYTSLPRGSRLACLEPSVAQAPCPLQSFLPACFLSPPPCPLQSFCPLQACLGSAFWPSSAIAPAIAGETLEMPVWPARG